MKNKFMKILFLPLLALAPITFVATRTSNDNNQQIPLEQKVNYEGEYSTSPYIDSMEITEYTGETDSDLEGYGKLKVEGTITTPDNYDELMNEASMPTFGIGLSSDQANSVNGTDDSGYRFDYIEKNNGNCLKFNDKLPTDTGGDPLDYGMTVGYDFSGINLNPGLNTFSIDAYSEDEGFGTTSKDLYLTFKTEDINDESDTTTYAQATTPFKNPYFERGDDLFGDLTPTIDPIVTPEDDPTSLVGLGATLGVIISISIIGLLVGVLVIKK